jgi:FtsH-binding integral membrane protein
MTALTRILFYGAFFAICYGIALLLPAFEAKFIVSGMRWIAALVGAPLVLLFTMAGKARELEKIDDIPFRSAERLTRKLKIRTEIIKTRWLIAFISGFLLALISFYFAYLDSQAAETYLIAAVIMLVLIGILFTVLTGLEFFHIIDLERDLRSEIKQIKAKQNFWIDKEKDE